VSEDIRIIHGDCREVMKMLDLGNVAAVVTDPPYGISFVKGDSGREVSGRRSLRRCADPILGDDNPFDPRPFLGWPCVLFGANHYYNRLPDGGTFHAWDKKCHSTLEDSFSDVEFIWTNWACKSRIISYLWKGVQQAGEKGRPKYHVSQKPVRVMCRLLEKFTKPGDLVVDPYAGSGSTLLACLKTGRRGIGIEVDPAHVATSRRRIEAARTPLFTEALP